MNILRATSSQLTQLQTGTLPLTTIYAASAAIIMGAFIISAVGFAGPEILHNAAHDIRHGLSFPCH